MSVSQVKVPLSRRDLRLSEVRSEAEDALSQLPVGLVKYRWEGDVLHFSAPSTEGQVFVRDGYLCARAELGLLARALRTTIMRRAREGLERFAERVKTAGGD